MEKKIRRKEEKKDTSRKRAAPVVYESSYVPHNLVGCYSNCCKVSEISVLRTSPESPRCFGIVYPAGHLRNTVKFVPRPQRAITLPNR